MRIYLDNAATSFPKPAAVYDAVDRYNRACGVAVGRSAYRQAMETDAVIRRCRQRVADWFHAEDANRIIFTFNGTDSLNLALHGLLNSGDHVVTSQIEHNSVLRPLRHLQEQIGIDVTYVEADHEGRISPDDVRSAIRPNTRLLALIHASNVTGAIQPIGDLCDVARDADALILIDAAQSAGHLPINLRDLPIDLLACPGHKGLLGPLGTGICYIRNGIEEQLQSHRQGGTGSISEQDRQPESLPDKYESGNHNAPGLIGLEAALTYLAERGQSALRAHEQELTGRLLDGLAAASGLKIYGPVNPEEQVGVVSLSMDGFEPQELAALLDEHFGIQSRAGLHCAPGAHRCIGTFDAGGTVRLSVGPFTTNDDIDAAIDAFKSLAE